MSLTATNSTMNRSTATRSAPASRGSQVSRHSTNVAGVLAGTPALNSLCFACGHVLLSPSKKERRKPEARDVQVAPQQPPASPVNIECVHPPALAVTEEPNATIVTGSPP